MTDRELSPAQRAQTQGNLELASQFVRDLLDAPERFDALPARATVVLLPPDQQSNPLLSMANIEMAMRLADQGRSPILWAVGQSEESGPQALPDRFIIDVANLKITYDRPRDNLTIAFLETDWPTAPTQLGRYLIANFALEAMMPISFSVPDFSVVAVKFPTLFDFVLLGTVKLIGTTPEEMLAWRNQLFPDRPTREPEVEIVNEILDELTRLSA
jgi:hypothetical protein